MDNDRRAVNLAVVPDATPEMAVQIHTLANGLSVYLAENHDEPWISCRVAVRAGAAQEPQHATGLAHYLEHMLANKGTRALGTRDPDAERPHLDRLRSLYEALRDTDGADGNGEADRRAALLAEIDDANQAANRWAIPNELKQAYGLLGARGLNAYTSHDRTVYTVDIPRNRLQAWAMLEGDRFASPVFRGFPTELETIIEEKNRALDNPNRGLLMEANARLWAGHPYSRDVLGAVEHLMNPSIAATEAFFRQWYVANNMAVVLAGDLDPDEALALVSAYFGDLPRGELPTHGAPVPTLPSGEQRFEITHHGDPEVRLVWRTVAREHEDAEALMLADMMLDNNSTGLLNTRLEQRQLVRAAGSFPGLRIQGGSQTVWGRPRIDQSLDEVEALLRAQVAALRDGDFREDDLRALIANFEVGELRRLESNSAQAALMLDAFTHGRSWDRVRSQLARLATLGRDQVVEAARRWLGDDVVVGRRREGEPRVTKIPVFGLRELDLDSDSHSPLFETVTTLDTPPLDVQILVAGEHFEVVDRPMPGVARLYWAANPNNDLYQLSMRRYVGAAHDPVLSKGLDLWGRAGVGELDLEGYRRTLFHRAAAIAVDCRRQQTTASIAGRAHTLPELLPLLRERLERPVIGEHERGRWASDLVGKRKQRSETAKFKFGALKQWALRGDQSPYLAEALSNDAVLALELDTLRAAPADLRRYDSVVMYAGTHSLEAVRELLATHFADVEGAATPDYQPTVFQALTGTRIFVVHAEAAQASVGVYIPSERYDPRRSPVYRLFHEYMGGPAGLVFQELREARGLAYSAHGGHSAGARLGDQNLVWASAASRPDRVVEAATVMLDLLRGPPLHSARFDRARGSAIEKVTSGRVRFRGFGATAESWRLRGLDIDPRPRVLAALRRGDLGLDALREFASPLADSGAAVVVAGDTSQIDLDALGRLGTVETRTLAELVAY